MTVAAVAIPQGIAYAAIAELPPQVGLYTAIVAAIVGSLWGSSPFLATGPTNATSLLTLSVLLPVFSVGSPEFVVGAAITSSRTHAARSGVRQHAQPRGGHPLLACRRAPGRRGPRDTSTTPIRPTVERADLHENRRAPRDPGIGRSRPSRCRRSGRRRPG
ncbi:MAG: hypothetical protein CME06_15860 [Gemmatimonadetes bacterium]|nr:hypothetical protein [Gemmatimonadota bacterium]